MGLTPDRRIAYFTGMARKGYTHNGQRVHRFTDLEADRREAAKAAAAQRREAKAAEWAAAATDDELRAIFTDGDFNPSVTKFARRGAALRELQHRAGR